MMIHEPRFEDDDDHGVGYAYGLADGSLLAQSAGYVTALEDRCFVFPNTLQHKVEAFALTDPTHPGVLRALTFLLVDPTKSIPSTSVISPQQQEWRTMASAPELRALRLPIDLLNRVMDFARTGMTREEAKDIRSKLIESRTPQHHLGRNLEFMLMFG